MCEQLRMAAAVLAAIGAINWGLVGLLNFNLVSELDRMLGAKNLVARIIYAIIGVAGVYTLIEIAAPCALFTR